MMANQQDILQIGINQHPQQIKASRQQKPVKQSIITTLLYRLRKLLIPSKSRRQLNAFQRMQDMQNRNNTLPMQPQANRSKTLPPNLQPNIRVEEQIARQQAQSAYRAQQKPQPREQWKDTQKDSALEREMRRSMEIKYAMGPRYEKPTPQPKTTQNRGPSNNKPIAYQPNTVNITKTEYNPTIANSTTSNMGILNAPGNKVPENNHDVVNFLKSVAELMEKDGKSNLANEIKKTLQ